RQQRRPEGVRDQPRQKDDHWRLIDIAPRKMLRAGEVVQLVAEIAVAIGGDDLHEANDRGDDVDGNLFAFHAPQFRRTRRSHATPAGRTGRTWGRAGSRAEAYGTAAPCRILVGGEL